eukprot:CAMPEP_0119405612 /NCGR_PEP_ID=MMETSP1335-20130426/198_1 /TAXON_ID=259385 /ORGANISM="Chrysoculter rhomboideus, Strain RCC1486" /LENGTH=154 /DNA_ID=CAMNT_0007429627 /DNA_START=416 /DNA_END=880 /DNA_ORIENTATION=+
MPLLEKFYKLLDAEFHMVASQRGKGFFYSGVGVLTLFIREESAFSLSFIGVASICLIVAGVMHSFRIVHEEAIGSSGKQEGGAQLGGAGDGPGAAAGASGGQPAFPPANAGAVPPAEYPPPPDATQGASEWNSMVASQHEREGAGYGADPAGTV